jgi:hypothetical protein
MIGHEGPTPGRTPPAAGTAPKPPPDGSIPGDRGTNPAVPVEGAPPAAGEVLNAASAPRPLREHQPARPSEPQPVRAGEAEAGRAGEPQPTGNPSPEHEHRTVDLARLAWLGTVTACLIAVATLVLEGYYGYAAVTFAVAASAALNLT